MARIRPRSRSTRLLGPLALAAAFVLLAAACGESGDDAAAPSGPDAADDQPAGPAAPGADGPLPAVDVVDVASGATVSLTDFNPGQLPLLVWFWAPH